MINLKQMHDIFSDIHIRHGYEALDKINDALSSLDPSDRNDKRRIKKLEKEKEEVNEMINQAISKSMESQILGDDSD